MTATTQIHGGSADPVLSARQRLLLELLAAFGGSSGMLDFQKLLFLYCQEQGSDAAYDFVPYRFGAFSFTSYADRRKLIDRGMLVEDDQRWALTDSARQSIVKGSDNRLAEFARRHRRLRGDALVAATYRRFPFHAIRSEIVDRVLADDDEARARIAAHRPVAGGGALCTIGYEGHTLERYLNLLLGEGVTLLCDVRRNPISRKYGFSKSTLSRGCEGVGIRYEHLPALGIASDKRRHLETQADYDALFAEYERSWLPSQREPLGKICDWIGSGQRVALTCYERLPEQCHRHCVSDALDAELGERLGAKHL